MTGFVPGLALVLAAALLAGTAVAQAPVQPPDILARRGTQSLTEAQLRELLAEADPAEREAWVREPARFTQIVRDRILREAMLAEARSQAFDKRPDVAARAERARNDAVVEAWLEGVGTPPGSYPSDAEIAAAYDANRASLMVPRQYRIAQLWLAVPEAGGKPAEDEALKRIRDLRAQALRPRADFAELARTRSEDKPSASRGGEFDWVREDRLLPALKDAVSGLQEGQLSEPVRGPQGWHVVKLLGTRPAAPAPLAEVRPSLVQALRRSRTTELQRLYLNELLRREPILIDELRINRLLTP